MREIKFRKWDFENKEMIDGDSLAFEEYTPVSHLLSQKGIMQYTGLKDKNGKEIFEGDILYITSNFELRKDTTQQVVTYDHWSFGTDEWALFELVRNQKKGEQDFEVIGNIYENPEIDFE